MGRDFDDDRRRRDDFDDDEDDDNDNHKKMRRRDDDDDDDRRRTNKKRRNDDDDDVDDEDDDNNDAARRRRRTNDDEPERRGRRRRDDADDDYDRRRRRENDDDLDTYERRRRRGDDDDDEPRRHARRKDDNDDDDDNNYEQQQRRRRRDDRDDDDDNERRRRRDDDDDNAERMVTLTMDVDKDDAAFILGRGGSTKRKIARVAGCDVELDENALNITTRGSRIQCDRARDYIDFVKQQRVGPVTISLDAERDDFSAYHVPEDCIGFVMGRSGQTLRSMEEEWGVLMFFAKTTTNGRPIMDNQESLCIFGPLPSRRGAEIKVMSAVEHKHPGFCVSSRNELREIERVPGDKDLDGWGTDTMLLSEENYSYALGAKGSTRKKLAAASGCIIEYVGRLACFCGYKRDRRRGKDYLRWLLEQRTGQSVVQNPRDRDDCTLVKIPSGSVAFITGHRGESLRDIERETSTFCFTDGDRAKSSSATENLLIFSYSRSARLHARSLVLDRVAEHKRLGGPRDRDDDRRRRRYDDDYEDDRRRRRRDD